MGIRSNINEASFATVTSDDVVAVRNAGTQQGFASFKDILEGAPFSVSASVTAHAGGGKTDAVPLTAAINTIGTVATTADSVLLPPALPGRIIIINNTAANATQVFGQGTDTINAVATATGVSQAGGTSAMYSCGIAGAWRRNLSA
jgi:hypothetical protein